MSTATWQAKLGQSMDGKVRKTYRALLGKNFVKTAVHDGCSN